MVAEPYLHAVFDKILLYRVIYLLSFFGTEMAYRTIYELKTRFYSAFSDLLDFFFLTEPLDVRIRSEVEIYLVGVLYHALSVIFTYKLGELSSYLVTERKLAVGERARAAESRGYMTVGFAVYADVGLCLGATAFFYRNAFFNYKDRAFIVVSDHFYRGKYTRRSRAYYYGIVFHILLLPPPVKGRIKSRAFYGTA